MSQIFVSYKRAEKERVKPIVDLLEAQGWSVWWDRMIPPGMTFEKFIEESIAEASVVVAVWSELSVASDWIKTEAAEGLERGILVPVRIDEVDPPFAFRQIHAADLTDLANRPDDDPEVQGLLASVGKLIRREERRRSGGTTGSILRLLRSGPVGEEKGEAGREAAAKEPLPGARAGWPAWPRGKVAALAVTGVALLTAIWALPHLLSGGDDGRDDEPGPPESLTFIGVNAGAEYREADDKLARYLKSRIGPQIGYELSDYETAVDRLANWNRKDGPFLARTTPYVFIAAEMQGADLEVLGTYQSRATGTTTYHSYFVVNRRDFPGHDAGNPPSLEELVDVLRSDRGVRRHRFIYHSKFSTSSYFLPSLFFRRNGIFHMAEPTPSLVAIDSDQIESDSSTDLVKQVALGEADLAAVWDGTKTKFDPDGGLWQEYGEKVLFIRIDSRLPNDLLVCSGDLHAETEKRIRDAVRAMGEAEDDLIDVGDFLRWKEWRQAEDAPEALAALRWSALAAPARVTVKIGAEGPVPEEYLEAAERAVRLSGTEFVVFDPDYHGHADFRWTLRPEHDGALRLTSDVIGLADSRLALEQTYWISFADAGELTERISAFIHSRMHRVRYLWPYADRPTVIRDVGFSLPDDSRVVAQKVDWLSPERNQISTGRHFATRVAESDLYKLRLDLAGFGEGLLGDPMSNVGYRVILERPSRESAVLRALSYLFVALLVLAAGGAVFDVARPGRRPAAAVPVQVAAAGPRRWRRFRAAAGAGDARAS